MLINKAISIAALAHDGQTDKAGKPYIFHPLRVMLNADGGEDVKCAAVLHDVLEDTAVTAADLEAAGFSEEILTALSLLTRKTEDDYMEYVKRLKNNPIAKAVKLADLADNMDMTRIPSPTERDYARLEKYKRALEILKQE